MVRSRELTTFGVWFALLQAFIHIETARSIGGLSKPEMRVLLPALPCSRYLENLQAAEFDVFDEELARRDTWLPFALLKKKLFGGF
jgi:hypothetical protein